MEFEIAIHVISEGWDLLAQVEVPEEDVDGRLLRLARLLIFDRAHELRIGRPQAQ